MSPQLGRLLFGLSALTGTCSEELIAVTVELAMEGWVDDSEIAVVNWEMNCCLCCNRYSASWSVKVIGVDRSALIICGEFSSGLVSDALGDISSSETSSTLNLFWISMGLLFLPTLVHPWESGKICDGFWKWEVMSFRRLITSLAISLVATSNAAWESFRSFVSGILCNWVWRWEVTSFRSAVNSFVISLFAASKAAWESFRWIS